MRDDFDIILTHIAPLASTDTGTAVQHPTVCTPLICTSC